MAFRTTLSVGIVVAGEAEIGKRAIGKHVGGRVRRNRHGCRRLLDQGRDDEDKCAEQTRRQVRQPIA